MIDNNYATERAKQNRPIYEVRFCLITVGWYKTEILPGTAKTDPHAYVLETSLMEALCMSGNGN